MKIFVIVGMPAAGKNIACTYAESEGLIYFATGDIVRAEVKKRCAEADAAGTAKISDELRGKDGMGVTRLALEKILQSGADVGFLEGMRSWQEIEMIREKADGIVVAVLAPRGLRLNRVCSRGRADDSPADFDERDQREIVYGTAIPLALADAYILNIGTMDNAMEQLDAIVRKEMDIM